MIGITVENPRGQRLGIIKDMVVDFNNDRVSYCVMSVENGPDHLAVPLAAFRPSADGTVLILNADKTKLCQARGFDQNEWPAVNSAAWGAEPPWQLPPTTVVGPPLQPVIVPSEEQALAEEEETEAMAEAFTPDFAADTPAWGSPPAWQTAVGAMKTMHDQVMESAISSH